MKKAFNILIIFLLSSCSLFTKTDDIEDSIVPETSDDISTQNSDEELPRTETSIDVTKNSTQTNPEQQDNSKHVQNSNPQKQEDLPQDPSIDYLYPSGEIDCKTSCSNFMTRKGGYPDFVESHFDNLGNQALNECYLSAITQGKSVSDLNCKEKALSGCIKFCEGSKPMEWRTRSRSDLQ